MDFLLLQCVQYKAALFTGKTLLGKKKHVIAKMLQHFLLCTLVSLIIYWKDSLQLAGNDEIKDVATVATFYNMNLDYLSEGLFSLASTDHMKDVAAVTAFYNRKLDYLTEGLFLLSFTISH